MPSDRSGRRWSGHSAGRFLMLLLVGGLAGCADGPDGAGAFDARAPAVDASPSPCGDATPWPDGRCNVAGPSLCERPALIEPDDGDTAACGPVGSDAAPNVRAEEPRGCAHRDAPEARCDPRGVECPTGTWPRLRGACRGVGAFADDDPFQSARCADRAVRVPGVGCVSAAAVLACHGARAPADLFVDLERGADDGVGGEEAPLATAGEALRRAHSGDIVELGPGEHQGPLEVPGGVTLRGACGAGARVVAGGTPAFAVRLSGDGTAKVEHLTLTGAGEGLVVDGADEAQVRGVLVENLTGSGIRVIGGTLLVEDVLVRRARAGVWLSGDGRVVGRRLAVADPTVVGVLVDGPGVLEVDGFGQRGGIGVQVESGRVLLTRAALVDARRFAFLTLGGALHLRGATVLATRGDAEVPGSPLLAVGGGVAVENALFGDNGFAALVGEGAELTLQDVVVVGTGDWGLRVLGRLEADGLALLANRAGGVAVRPGGEANIRAGWVEGAATVRAEAAHGIAVSDGALVLDDSVITASLEAGVSVVGGSARAEVRRSVVVGVLSNELGAGVGVLAREGAQLTLEDVRVEDSVGAGVWLIGAAVDARRLEVARVTAGPGRSVARGLHVDGGVLRADGLTVLDVAEAGVLVAAAGDAELGTVRVARVGGSADASAEGAVGIQAEGDAILRVHDAWVSEVVGQGIAAFEADTVDLEGVRVEGVRVARGRKGQGIVLGNVTTARLTQSTVRDARSVGLLCFGATTLTMERTLVEGTRADGTGQGRGVALLEGVQATLEGNTVRDHLIASLSLDAGVVVRSAQNVYGGTRPLLQIAFGILIEGQGAELDSRDDRVRGNVGVGVGVLAPSALTMRRGLIGPTSPADVGVGGIGIFAGASSRVALEATVVEDSGGAGVLVTDGASLRLADVLIASTAPGGLPLRGGGRLPAPGDGVLAVAAGALEVSDTWIRGCGAGGAGFFVEDTEGQVRGTVSNCDLELATLGAADVGTNLRVVGTGTRGYDDVALERPPPIMAP